MTLPATSDLVVREWRRSSKTDNVSTSDGKFLVIQSMVEEHNALVAAYQQVVRENESHALDAKRTAEASLRTINRLEAERDAALRERDEARAQITLMRAALERAKQHAIDTDQGVEFTVVEIDNRFEALMRMINAALAGQSAEGEGK